MKTGIRMRVMVVWGLGLTGACYSQGDLTPPGAPSPTMKTLEQVEPRIDVAALSANVSNGIVIATSGSYYLSANLEVSTTNGITIAVAGVTLDLNGFEISRIAGSGGEGISISGGADRATVRNGTIVGFDYGIRCNNAFSEGSLFEKLAVSGCLTYGIYGGLSSRIIDCRTHDNPGSGIFAHIGSSISGCTAYNNQGTYGIYASSGSSISGCTANNNQCRYGIRVGSGATLKECIARSNTGDTSSSYGIYTGSGCVVMQCAASDNTHTNGSSTAQQGVGINVGSHSTVKDCVAYNNQGDGIRVGSESIALENTCYRNGKDGDGAGINAGYRSQIIGSHVSANDRGIEVTGTHNTLGGNTAVGNTSNYEIDAGNSYGDIVDNTGDAGSAPAHSGNGAAGGTISANNNPWANFSL